jgi:hypothetical protein
MRFGFSPKTQKAQPITIDRLGWVVVCGGLRTAAYCLKLMDAFHLLSVSKIWARRILKSIA